MIKNEIENLINCNFSQREIAIELKSSQSNVRHWLKKFNLKTNNNLYNKKEYCSVENRIEKLCPKCKITKPIGDFYAKNKNKTWSAGYCKKCSNRYHSKRAQQVKIKMIQYKGGKCVDCKLKLEDSHYNVFDFHHLNPDTKDSNFKKIKYQKWEYIKKEINKCVLLCSNCHRLRHAEKIIID